MKETVRVLCVQGQPDEAQYVALALNPSKNDRPRVRTEIAAESAVLETDLRPYDCVFLCNVGRFSRDEAGVLRDYLRGGGGLVFFLGDQVQAESYNTVLGGEAADHRVLPARLEQTVSEAQYRFDPRGYRHPIVAPFRDQPLAGRLADDPRLEVFSFGSVRQGKRQSGARLRQRRSGDCGPTDVSRPQHFVRDGVLHGIRRSIGFAADPLDGVANLAQLHDAANARNPWPSR